MSHDDREAVRLTAYFLWEQAGRPPGREWEFWREAEDRHRRQRESDTAIAGNLPAGDSHPDAQKDGDHK